MRLIEQTETWFSQVSDEDLYNFAVEHLGLFGPTITRLRTRTNIEYVRIVGLKSLGNGAVKKEVVNYGYYGPVRINENGQAVIDLDKVSENLQANKTFIHMMDEKNLGRVYQNTEYADNVRSLHNYIIRAISLEDRERI